MPIESLASVGGNVRVWDNPVLTSITGLGALQSLDDLSMQSNDSLCSSVVQALIDRLRDGGWIGSTSNVNNDSC